MNKLKLCLVAVTALVTLPKAAYAWWNDDWAFRKQLNLDLSAAGANIAGDATDVPVLIRLHPGNFSYFADVRPDGADLRFVAADDATPLPFHIERFDPANQIALLWVRVPRLAGGADGGLLYLYYGNPAAASASDPAGTYDASQALVYHFSEGGETARDSTAYGNHPTRFDAALESASLIGGGAAFAGGQSIEVPESPSLRIQPDRGVTLSVWVRADQPQQQAYVASLEDLVGRALVLGIDGSSAVLRLAVPDGEAVTLASPDLTLGEWHHLALRAGNGRLSLVVDGEEVAAAEVTLPEIAAPLVIGQSAAGGNGFDGRLDELQVSSTLRSAEWLRAASVSQSAFGGLVVYGGDAQREGGGESYFAITLRNVTTDGWVVIFLLGVMFAISLVVMTSKALLLARVERQNRRFLAEYRSFAGDPLSLAQTAGDDGAAAPAEAAPAVAGGDYEPSTLLALYRAGTSEVRRRLQSPAVGALRRGFTAEAIGAIRATVDAAFVHERQKLNRQMVLLTIAISGGPFLGLLGTVVGVMITFAAIAASGDVNVNAIAPGIAAALVATVAGLAVAIPALFGYNWLSSRIKEIDAQTHVFADELVNRLAEHYA